MFRIFSGKPQPSIQWHKNGEPVQESNLVSISNTDGKSLLHIRDARRGDSGQYTVNLKNPVGSKSLTVAVKVLDCPGPPSDVSVSDVSASRAKVTWIPPKDDGGAAVTKYIVEKRETSRLAWTLVAADVSFWT